MRLAAPALLVLAWVVAPPARAADHHVTPDGSPRGDGTRAAPWDIVTAWSQPATVAAGDTIWLHEGTYAIVGTLTAALVGTPESPIVVRQADGERATLDTGDSAQNRIVIVGEHTWYWGFEVMSSAPDRWADDGMAADRGYSIDVGNSGSAVGVKLINLIVHDTQGAIGLWSPVTGDSEIYGCLIYFNGFDFTDRGHGHGIYTQNIDGAKALRDTIIFGQYSHGIHAYTEGGMINDFVLEGNIAFENGVVSSISGRTRNILVGGAPVAEDPLVRENYTWFDLGSADGTSCDLGYGSGTSNAIAQDNVLVGAGTSLRLEGPGAQIDANVLVGPTLGFDVAAFPDNEYYADPPTGVSAFVRPNAYDSDRAHVAVFNWDGLDTVDVDLTGFLAPGETFELRDAQDYFGTPVAEGSFDGAVVNVPMSGLAAAAVIGEPATPYVHTAATFGAFVLVRTGVGPGGDSSGGGENDGGQSSGGATDEGGSAGATTLADGGSTTASDPTGGSESGGAGSEGGGGCGCRDGEPGARLAWLVVLAARRRRSRERPPAV